MNPTQFIETSYWEIAGWTMLNFLWLGSLLAVAAAGGRFALRNVSPQVRYAYAVGCLALLTALPVAIFVWVAADARPDSRIAETPAIEEHLASQPDALPAFSDEQLADAMLLFGDQTTHSQSIDAGAPRENQGALMLSAAAALLPWLWIAGAPLMLVITFSGLLGTARLRRRSSIVVDGELATQCERLRRALHMGRRVSIAVCDRVASPILIGVVKPVILLPPAALCGWSGEQLEMVLLHELAHVRRFDNLVNLVQRLIESLLFYHPAVWVISGWVRAEREDCCDAVVVRHTGRADIYAETLAALAGAHARANATAAAMAQNNLKSRIRRLLNVEDRTMRISIGKLGLLFVGMLVVALVVVRARESGSAVGSGEVGGAAEISAEEAGEDLPFAEDTPFGAARDLPFAEDLRFSDQNSDAFAADASHDDGPFDALLSELSEVVAVDEAFTELGSGENEVEALRRQRDEYQLRLRRTEADLARMKTILDEFQRQMTVDAETKAGESRGADQVQRMWSDELRLVNEQIKQVLGAYKNPPETLLGKLKDRARELDANLRVHEDSSKQKKERTDASSETAGEKAKEDSDEWKLGLRMQMPIGARKLESERRHFELQKQRLRQQEEELEAQQAEIQKRRRALELMVQQKENELERYWLRIGFLNRDHPPASDPRPDKSGSKLGEKAFDFFVGTDEGADRSSNLKEEIARLKDALALMEAGAKDNNDESAVQMALEWFKRRIRQLEEGAQKRQMKQQPRPDDSSPRSKADGRDLSNQQFLLDVLQSVKQAPSNEDDYKRALELLQRVNQTPPGNASEAVERGLEFLHRSQQQSSSNDDEYKRALEALLRAVETPSDVATDRALDFLERAQDETSPSEALDDFKRVDKPRLGSASEQPGRQQETGPIDEDVPNGPQETAPIDKNAGPLNDEPEGHSRLDQLEREMRELKQLIRGLQDAVTPKGASAADARRHNTPGDEAAWILLGLLLEPAPASIFEQNRPKHRGGLTVVRVRADSPASKVGIRRGDILVGLHTWETTSLDAVDRVLHRKDLAQLLPLKIHILRDKETLYGHLHFSAPKLANALPPVAVAPQSVVPQMQEPPLQYKVAPVEPIPGRWPARPQTAPQVGAPPAQTRPPTYEPSEQPLLPPSPEQPVQPSTDDLPALSSEQPAIAASPRALPTEQPAVAEPALALPALTEPATRTLPTAPAEQPALAAPQRPLPVLAEPSLNLPALAEPAAATLPVAPAAQPALAAPEQPLPASTRPAPRPRALPAEPALAPDPVLRPSARPRLVPNVEPRSTVAPSLEPAQPRAAATPRTKEKPSPSRKVKPKIADSPEPTREPVDPVGAEPAEQAQEPKSKDDSKLEPSESQEAAASAEEPAEESSEPAGEPAEPLEDIPAEIEP